MDEMTPDERIAFGKALLRDLREADRRGVHPAQLLDERDGAVLGRSQGWPCVLRKWTDIEDDSNDGRAHNAEGRAHVGQHGVTMYAVKDGSTLVRFGDGKEIWCTTSDLSID